MKKKFRRVSSTTLTGKPTRFVSVVLLITMLLALAVSSGTLVYVFASPSPTSTYYAEEGIYPGAVSYTIWVEGSTYYGKDANGHVVYISSNASQTINNAITALHTSSTGGKILLKAGVYTIDGEIQIPASPKYNESFSLSIIGETISNEVYYTKLLDVAPQGTVLQAADGYTGHIIFVGYNASSGYNVKNIEISHLFISGHELPYTSTGSTSITMDEDKAGLRALNVINGDFHHLCFVNCYYGIYMTTNAGNNDGVQISHVWIGYNKYGILVNGASHSVAVHHIYSYLNYATAIYLCGSGIVTLSDVYSNADCWEILDYPESCIRIYGKGFATLQNVVIFAGKDGNWSGIRGLYLTIAETNGTLVASNIYVQGVNGTAVYVKESGVQGIIYLHYIFASSNATCPVGGEGRNNGYGVYSQLSNATGTILYLEDSFLYNNVQGAYYGNFTKVDDISP